MLNIYPFQVTQAEVNAGRVTKEASVSGSAVNGDPVGDIVETVVELPWAPEVDVGEPHIKEDRPELR